MHNKLALKRSSNMATIAPERQRGAVLIFALILLLVMTVLAISGVDNSTLQQRMAGNYSQSVAAFQAAEQGLRVAEEWLYDRLANDAAFQDMSSAAWYFKDTSLTDGLYTAISAHPDNAKVCVGNQDCEFDPRDEAQWCSDMGNVECRLPKGFVTLSNNVGTPTSLHGVALPSVGHDLDGDGTIDSVAKQPQFIIEYIGPSGQWAKPITLGVKNLSSPLHAFRITVMAWGHEDSVRHVLESHVILPL